MAGIRHNLGKGRSAAPLAARRAVLCAVAAAMLGQGGFGASAATGEHKGTPTPTPAATATAATAPAAETANPEGGANGRDRRTDGKARERSGRDNGRQTRVALLPELGRARPAAPWEAAAASESIRPRGAAAPVALREDDQAKAADRQGREFAAGGSQRGAARQPGKGGNGPQAPAVGSEDKPLHGRIWPMPSGAYTFTQEFGCVEQIGGFYPAAAECPPERPVVHRGIDLAAETGELIYAAVSGWVTQAGYDRETGLANTRLVIQHDGRNGRYATEYLHWITTFVEPGDYVQAGQPIAEVGSVGWSTGPHLHFAVIDFERGEYVDPLGWLPKRESSAYRELPRNPRPVRFDDGESGDSTLPDAADPHPAPIPERTDPPMDRRRHVQERRAEDRAAADARTERKSERIAREADRDQRAAERRKRIRHDDGESVTVNDPGASGTGEAASGDNGDSGKRRDGHDGRSGDGGRRDRGSGDGEHGSRREGGGRGESGGSSGGSGGGERGRGQEASGGGRESGPGAGGRKQERAAAIDGGADSAPEEVAGDTGISSRVAALLEDMP